MGKSSSAPDPYATAAAQTQSNQQTAAYNAALNRTSQYTPYGNSVYSQTGKDSTGAPIWSNTITLAPEAQKQLDNQLAQNDQLSNIGFTLADQAQNSLANPVSTAGMPAVQYGVTQDFSGAQKQAQDAAYKQATGYLDPQYANAQSDLDAKLANQGVVQGSDAWGRAQDTLGRQKTLAYNQAQDSAIQTGNAEQNTLYAQAMQGVNANNSGIAQNLNQQTQLATLPLNQLNALRSGTQITNPSFTAAPTATSANTDISGDIYKSYQLNQANNNNVMSGLFSLGGSALGAAGAAGSFGALFSDRRLKRDIRRVGRTPTMGLPLYEYSYQWAPGQRVVGVMADEVARVAPHAVLRHPSGYRMVDYRMVS